MKIVNSNSWFAIIKKSKPMPLPVYPKVDNKLNGGLSIIDRLMRQETADTIKNQYPQIEWLQAGGMGVANECEPGIVCKFTDQRREADIALYFKNNPNQYVMKIFDVKLIQVDPFLWMIKSEKLKTLNYKDSELYYDVIELMPDNLVREALHNGYTDP